jgi:hypothetical protein
VAAARHGGPVGVPPDRPAPQLPRPEPDAGEAGELDHRSRDLTHRVRDVQLHDLVTRAVAPVAHDAGHLDLAVGRDLVGADPEV